TRHPWAQSTRYSRAASQESAATVGEPASTMGWLPHTTRAALTGLRQRGYVFAIDRSDRQRGSIYRIEAKPHTAGTETRALVPEIAWWAAITAHTAFLLVVVGADKVVPVSG